VEGVRLAVEILHGDGAFRCNNFEPVDTLSPLFMACSKWSVAVPRRDVIRLCHLPSAKRYGCRSSSGLRRSQLLAAMSNLAFPEVAFRTMVASALQPVQLDDKIQLAVLEQRGRRNAVCWLAPCRRLAGIVSLFWFPHMSHALCMECGGSSVDTRYVGTLHSLLSRGPIFKKS